MRKLSTSPNTVAGIPRPRRTPAWLRRGPFRLLMLTLACSGGPTRLAQSPGDEDPTTPPPGTPPPPDSPAPDPPPGPVSHVGLAFGLAQMPTARFSEFSATTYTATDPDELARDLEVARRANARLFISFTGNQENFQDSSGGFDMAKWKQRMDRFRELDLAPYIEEETIAGHLLLDEPYDTKNWNGKPVSRPDIEELARYSKEVWPSMVTVLRTHYDYLQGYEYPHLDAVRTQYHSRFLRFGSLDDYIEAHIEVARSLGQAMIGGVNVLNGGSNASGIPGYREGQFAMSADELRSWGGRFLTHPYICGFIMYQYDSAYLARPDIQTALAELSEIARSIPKKACRG